MNGVDLTTIQELLGHKSIIMTKRYSHPTPEHKKSAVGTLTIILEEHVTENKKLTINHDLVKIMYCNK